MGSVRHERGSGYGSSFVILPLGRALFLCVGTDPSLYGFVRLLLDRIGNVEYGVGSLFPIFGSRVWYTMTQLW